jgi:thioredoxin reductase
VAVAGGGRPFPPGEYGVVVVGTGPGGLQTSYSLARLGIDHALLSADDGPGGMFRTFPLFERLISWTHDAEPGEQETRAYETHDQNSLVADQPELRGLVTGKMADGRRRPARDEMEAGLVEFAERAGIRARYGCRWETTRRDSNVVVTTGDGEYHCRAVVFAIGATEPWVPPIPGLELDHHYALLEDAPERFRGRRVVIVGKRNSAFEVGEALLRRGVRELTLVSPRPPDMARLARSPLRPWYLTPYDEHVRGAPGRYVLDASIDRVERAEAGFRVHALDPTRADPLLLDADVVVAATGFRAPLADLPELGVATVADGRLPALTPYWESVTVPGIFFAGNVTQAATGLRKHGVASLSSMVCGFRYNARLLADHLAEAVFGRTRERPQLASGRVVPYLIAELNGAPELAMQKGYLARVLRPHPQGGLADEGIVPLEVFVDAAHDGAAVTLEFDAEERIRPVLYVRRSGALDEVVMPPHPLRRYDDPEYRGALAAGLAPLLA